jgi:hypothetical protein
MPRLRLAAESGLFHALGGTAMTRIPSGYQEVDVSGGNEDEDDLDFYRELMDESVVVDEGELLASGFHEVDLNDETRLEDGLCWNDAEVETRLRDAWAAGIKRPEVSCGYCAEKGIDNSRQFRRSELRAAIDWFRFHQCGVSTEAIKTQSAPERIPQLVAA